MLESAGSLLDAEGILHSAIELSAPLLLCAVPLTCTDVARLQDLVRQEIARSPRQGLERLLQHGRATLSLFLTTQARDDYQEGSYWPGIHKILGLRGPRVEQQLGRALRQTLDRYRMPHVDSDEGQQYVGSILLHAGLVSATVQQFYEEIVLGAFWQQGLQDAFSVRSALAAWRAEGLSVPSAGPPDLLARDPGLQARRISAEREGIAQQLEAAEALLASARGLASAREDGRLLQGTAGTKPATG